MTQKKYNTAVFIGRFSPWHKAHAHTLQHALELAEHVVIIIGSSNRLIDWKNPFTYQERKSMIEMSLDESDIHRIHFNSVDDKLYQDQEWIASVDTAVDSVLQKYTNYRTSGNKKANICLIGYEKDSSSWYLKAFPQWKLEETPMFNFESSDIDLNATMIREMIYTNKFGYTHELLPEGTYQYLKTWINNDSNISLGDYTSAFKYVTDWYHFEKEYQKPYEALPYGTNFICSDAVVIQDSHVLLIKRKQIPGAGAWAICGGHVNKDENTLDAAIRELKEESRIKVPEKVLRGSLVDQKVFDHPSRSLRGRVGKSVGRTISHSFCFHLTGGDGFPKVKGADDATEARFFTLNEIRSFKDKIFEDHYDQIEYFMSRIQL